ncbi:uncharacterized protein TM35_000601140, partial [Trypanosoma theileri]
MMLLRRLFFMALLWSVACVCVAGEDNEEEESLLSDVGDCRDPGNTVSKCKPNPKQTEDSPECKEHSDRENCLTSGDESEENCREDSKPLCPPKEPAPTTPKGADPSSGLPGPAGTEGPHGLPSSSDDDSGKDGGDGPHAPAGKPPLSAKPQVRDGEKRSTDADRELAEKEKEHPQSRNPTDDSLVETTEVVNHTPTPGSHPSKEQGDSTHLPSQDVPSGVDRGRGHSDSEPPTVSPGNSENPNGTDNEQTPGNEQSIQRGNGTQGTSDAQGNTQPQEATITQPYSPSDTSSSSVTENTGETSSESDASGSQNE